MRGRDKPRKQPQRRKQAQTRPLQQSLVLAAASRLLAALMPSQQQTRNDKQQR